MTDDELFRTVESEVRRFFTSHRVANASTDYSNDGREIHVSGECPFCGSSLRTGLTLDYVDPLGLPATCQRCGELDSLFFDAFGIKEYRDYFAPIAGRLKTARRIGVIGRDERQLYNFFRYDVFGIDYGKILGIAELAGIEGRFAGNYPILSHRELLRMQPDALLVLAGLPRENGLEAARDALEAHVPLVFLTKRLSRPAVLMSMESRSDLGLCLEVFPSGPVGNTYETVPPDHEGIWIVDATYGWNRRGATLAENYVNWVCQGNCTDIVSLACNGEERCEFLIDGRELGDPAIGWTKDFIVRWRYGNSDEIYAVRVAPEADGRTVTLARAQAPWPTVPDRVA